ncbi:PAS domain-containing protein [Humisphaera borealis]|uniref:PAS domain-containing protein n=1 Tax=Humisphaera borealis TaxID=2807512 RepID=A0A7M2WVV4_9BACT|nr:PAS domain-containing protein [Humisphaera borealis]QOV89352.1 PAS domain-containing protein [Humisphaera borealis]
MARPSTELTGVETTFGADEIIVSKTDLKGRIEYANQVFLRVSGYTEAELLGQPHCILRHPRMPRIVFRLLWDTISTGQEVFAYVLNRCKNGDHYWVFAHVTPSFDESRRIVGYHSNRRLPDRRKLAQIEPIYDKLLQIESIEENPRAQMERSRPVLEKLLKSKAMSYPQFIFSL